VCESGWIKFDRVRRRVWFALRNRKDRPRTTILPFKIVNGFEPTFCGVPGTISEMLHCTIVVCVKRRSGTKWPRGMITFFGRPSSWPGPSVRVTRKKGRTLRTSAGLFCVWPSRRGAIARLTSSMSRHRQNSTMQKQNHNSSDAARPESYGKIPRKKILTARRCSGRHSARSTFAPFGKTPSTEQPPGAPRCFVLGQWSSRDAAHGKRPYR
jgi:hypothetical protein